MRPGELKKMRQDPALKIIARLYCALLREGWEEGPTIDEATTEAQDYFYEKYGYGACAASDVLKALGRQP